LPSQKFQTAVKWSREQLEGFFESWSAVRNYVKSNKQNPVDLVKKDIGAVWSAGEQKEFYFPIYLRIGRIVK
jgi:hypothetical protein